MHLPKTGLELKLKDVSPFNQPGRKAATNRYLNILLGMIEDEEQRERIVRRAVEQITGSQSLVTLEAFRQELNDVKGFISGPAYATIRQLVFEAYGDDVDAFLTDFNLRLLQNPEKDIYILGGFLVDIDKLYSEVVKGTPNFTDALELRAPAQLSLLDGSIMKRLEREFGGPARIYQWQWRVRDHYLEDCREHIPSNSLENILLFDAKQTIHMAKTLPVFDTSTKTNQGVILDDNLKEVTRNIVSGSAHASAENNWYKVTIAVPAPKGGMVRKAFSYARNARRAERHLAQLSEEIDRHIEQLQMQAQAANEASQEHLEIADRLEQVVEYMRSFNTLYDTKLKKMVESAKKPRVVENVNIPRYERLYSQEERRRNILFPTPRALLDIQQRIVRFAGAREEVLDELRRLTYSARQESLAAQEYRDHIINAVAAGVGHIKYMPGQGQYSQFLKIIQNTDGYTYYHTRQTVLAYEIALEHYARTGSQRAQIDRIPRDLLHKAAILHDIGKIGLYIGTPGERFSAKQKFAIRQHTDLGANILTRAGAEREVVELALLHHEQPDGKGYHGYTDAQIPLHVQLFTPCDVYSAVRTRAYQRGHFLSHEQAIEEILDYSGTQFFEEAARNFAQSVSDNPSFVEEFDELTERMARVS